MDFSKTLFRAHTSGDIMTDPQAKAAKEAGLLGETCKKFLRRYYREVKYKRTQELNNKYVQKGLQCEEDAITLYSRVKKLFFKKNEEKLCNEYICGTPDYFNDKVVFDIKNSWDLFTFPFPSDPVNKDYYWQLQCYMALTGTQEAKLVYCLIDTPLPLIMDEKRKLLYKMAVVSEDDKLYQQACEEIERNMTFGDIDMKERVLEFTVYRNDDDLEKLYARIKKCREYLQELEGDGHVIQLQKSLKAV